MSNVNIYFNFMGNTLEVFEFYKSVFGGNFSMVQKFSDIPDLPGIDQMKDSEKDGIMHISLPILGGNMILMGTDAVESFGHKLNIGNNIYLSLNVDSKEEAEKYFNALSKGGEVEMPLGDTFWGAYYASLRDKYGTGWMINYEYPKN